MTQNAAPELQNATRLTYPGTDIPLIRGGAPDEPAADAGAGAATVAEDSTPFPTYQIDDAAHAVDATRAAPAAADAPSPTPAAAPPTELLSALDRASAIERQFNEFKAQFAPIIDERQRALTEAATKPPVDMQKLQNGDATPQELMAYIDWMHKRGLADVSSNLARQMRQASSEAEARGRFSREAMGEGRDYDSLRATYLESAYQQNPAIRNAVHVLSPDNPAVGEMYVAGMLHLIATHKGDHVKALKALFDSASARAEGGEEVSRTITEAARRGAAQIARDRGPGPKPRKIDAQAIWDMTDAEFKELERQNGVA